MGAEDINRNGKFYVYFASLLPELIPSIKGLGSAPNIWNRTYVPLMSQCLRSIHPHDARNRPAPIDFQRHAEEQSRCRSQKT